MYAAEYSLSSGESSFPSSSLINTYSSAALLAGRGPRFGSKSKIKQDIRALPFRITLISGRKKNIRSIGILLGVAAITILWLRTYQPSQLIVHLTKQTAALHNIPAANSGAKTAAPSSPGVTLELKSDGITAVLPNNQIDIITEEAERGDSVTLLARRAIAERFQDESLLLSPEQRIYAEDFVQKSIGAPAIYAGQKLSFAAKLLDEAIQKSQALTPRQLKNLSRYVSRVHF